MKVLSGAHIGLTRKTNVVASDKEPGEPLRNCVNAPRKVPRLPEPSRKPSRFGRLFFRLLVLEYARDVTIKDRTAPGRFRQKMLRASVRFGFGIGHTPGLGRGLARVPFAALENSLGPISPASEAMLTRFFRVKVQSLHFCGAAFHDRPLIEGFRNLALLYPVIIWLGRWLAASGRRTTLADADMERALAMVDHHYSYTPYLRWRVQLLNHRDDIARLCEWYRG